MIFVNYCKLSLTTVNLIIFLSKLFTTVVSVIGLQNWTNFFKMLKLIQMIKSKVKKIIVSDRKNICKDVGKLENIAITVNTAK